MPDPFLPEDFLLPVSGSTFTPTYWPALFGCTTFCLIAAEKFLHSLLLLPGFQQYKHAFGFTVLSPLPSFLATLAFAERRKIHGIRSARRQCLPRTDVIDRLLSSQLTRFPTEAQWREFHVKSASATAILMFSDPIS